MHGAGIGAQGRGAARVTLVVHATAVAIGRRGVLIVGASGTGKSGLALRAIALGARLVADDRVVLEARDGKLVARAPAELAGIIEARGIGLLRLDAVAEAEVVLAVDLDREPSARMPHLERITYMGLSVELIFGRNVPNLDLALIYLVQNGRAYPE